MKMSKASEALLRTAERITRATLGRAIDAEIAAEQAHLADSGLDVEQRMTLRDLARESERQAFTELAACWGVPADVHEALWALHRGIARA